MKKIFGKLQKGQVFSMKKYGTIANITYYSSQGKRQMHCLPSYCYSYWKNPTTYYQRSHEIHQFVGDGYG